MKEDYRFAWDERKNRVNLRKHGVSFEEAMLIWDDPMFVQVRLRSSPEVRGAVICRIAKDRYLAAVITYRGETVRIISARRATKKEVDIYGRH